MQKIILATTSPYRKDVFKSLNIPFEAEDSMIDESILERSNPEDLVKELSKLKAETVARNHAKAIVIGFDSVGFFQGKILEKPNSREQAFQRIKSLSGKSHSHYTGIYIINTQSGKSVSRVNKTDIFMRDYTDREIKKYLDQDENFNRFALGYNTEKCISASFMKKIEGNHLNLKGIPLSDLIEMMEEVGYKIE